MDKPELLHKLSLAFSNDTEEFLNDIIDLLLEYIDDEDIYKVIWNKTVD